MIETQRNRIRSTKSSETNYQSACEPCFICLKNKEVDSICLDKRLLQVVVLGVEERNLWKQGIYYPSVKQWDS